ncbi:hypothetical protein HKBW3S43_00373 [Candidatus Hakubella thermalkaliphila]|nr:hypothetical protein [Candidatus Hakubella thermalkaliphila]GFP34580.1 hypothetical protein HKBW3S43_00373 [Candidatus Hakubella thermalkaliphila]
MVERIVSALKRKSRYKDRVEHIEFLPPKDPVYGELKKGYRSDLVWVFLPVPHLEKLINSYSDLLTYEDT